MAIKRARFILISVVLVRIYSAFKDIRGFKDF